MVPKNQQENSVQADAKDSIKNKTAEDETKKEGAGLRSKIANVKDPIVGAFSGNNKDIRDPSEIKLDEAKEAFKNQTADLEDTKNLIVGEAGVVKDTVADKTEKLKESLQGKISVGHDAEEKVAADDDANKSVGLKDKIVDVKDSVVGKVGDIRDSFSGNKDTRDPSEIKFDEAKEAFKNQTADFEDTKNLVVGEAGYVKDAVAEVAENLKTTLTTTDDDAEQKADDAKKADADDTAGVLGSIKSYLTTTEDKK